MILTWIVIIFRMTNIVSETISTKKPKKLVLPPLTSSKLCLKIQNSWWVLVKTRKPQWLSTRTTRTLFRRLFFTRRVIQSTRTMTDSLIIRRFLAGMQIGRETNQVSIRGKVLRLPERKTRITYLIPMYTSNQMKRSKNSVQKIISETQPQQMKGAKIPSTPYKYLTTAPWHSKTTLRTLRI